MASAKSKGEPQGRKREVLGICLLGFGIFSVLSLISMHAGNNRMMGPGGAAAAAGLYSLAGFGAYLVVAAMLVVAVRCFRGRLLQRGFAEVTGTSGVLAAMAVLLHLPFADEPVVLSGPGGVIGQWLGEILASFIGGVGAALAAATLLCISLLLLTDVRIGEVLAVVTWAGRQVGSGLKLAGAAVGQVVVAMFPEKDEREEAARLRAAEADDEAFEDEEEAPPPRRLAAREAPRVLPPAPVAALEEDESDAVRIGQAPPYVEEEDPFANLPEERPVRTLEDEERRAVAALVAEVAAVECATEEQAQQQAQAALEAALEPTVEVQAPEEEAPVIVEPQVAAKADPVPPPLAAAREEAGPIIVEPAWRARQRREEEAAAAAAEAEEAADPGDDGKGFIQLSDGAFALPATQMLEYQPPQGTETDKQALYEMAERLEQAMANYGVRGKVKEIHMGPVVTMFEFAPAPGTRTGKIAQLENDLAMALEAQAVRIVAPIPGKAVVGVEVPNKRRETVYLKEILEDDCFSRAGSKLQVGLGKDIKGAPVSVNLAKMPHLLVAGTTGSGKSVAVNSMITSVLYNATPEEVRFIMVDPKMLELSIYEGIPHLLLPVVTDPKKANLALRWAVEEMERRYELLAKSGVRDIGSYNARLDSLASKQAPVAAPLAEVPSSKRRLTVTIAGPDGVEREVEVDAEAESAAAAAAEPPVPAEELAEEESNRAAAVQFARENPEEAPARKLPYIIIVIDEFADLMMVAPKDVETSVARIAQKARAAGLHLILATQRPSVDVITGLIKANFPSRIALQVASKIDSRTILDQPGAETLLGNGDMLFSDRGTKLRRIHGAFLSDEEVHRVVDFLKKQAKPVYDMDILKPRDEDQEEGAAPADDFHDALYDQAVAIVCETRQASVSFIQRRLQIGYNRAARMVEQMERDGIVGPANGIKPREVLAPAGEYLENAV
jgi:S-DNA-T family DNA segregation ATPase FtsK/SpoIIIE